MAMTYPEAGQFAAEHRAAGTCSAACEAIARAESDSWNEQDRDEINFSCVARTFLHGLSGAPVLVEHIRDGLHGA